MNEKLLENLGQSLIDQDLDWCYTLDTVGGSTRPLSVLYDSLVRPGADLGAQISSRLSWQTDEMRRIPHLVLGETPVGGSWNNYDQEMLAVSFSSWLDLPGFSISDWLQGTPLVPRLPSVAIVEYMKSYVKEMGLSKNIIPHTKVTSVKLPTHNPTLPIVYGISNMRSRLEDSSIEASASDARVVVIGDGISSADAVRLCLEHEIPVLHVMRRTERQLRNTVLSRLSPLHYGEYHSIYRLMIGRDTHPLYEMSYASSVVDVDQKSVITITTPKGNRYKTGDLWTVSGKRKDGLGFSYTAKHVVLACGKTKNRKLELPTHNPTLPIVYGISNMRSRLEDSSIEARHSSISLEKCSMLVVCIGRVSDLEGLLTEKYTFTGYQSEEDPTLLCAGSFAGDHFVRYVVGGCLEVARLLTDYYKDTNNNDT
ncbi:hypothetical protein OSTOST_12004 [Ostertagia ostertagi]